MIEALRLTGTGALKSTDLLNLGQINVICGKNNSGKSTLLAAIASADRSVGRELSSEEVEAIAIRAGEASPWKRGSGYDSERSVYMRCIQDVLKRRSRWFASEADQVVAAINKSIGSDHSLGRFAVNTGFVGIELARVIGNAPETVLIPPKRNLQLTRAIALNEPVQPTGEGLLNFLFYAKTQPARSGERNAFDKLLEAFTKISSGFRFDVFPNRENQISLNFGRAGQGWLSGYVCGLGLQDLLLLLYFVVVSTAPLLLIEEPESHLHPDMQRRLLAFCRDEAAKQMFVTTHSNVFLNNVAIDRVFFTTFTDHIVVDDATSRASILDDLGYSVTDNLVSDLVILVEGPSDVPVVEEFLHQMGLLSRHQIKIWPLGGDIMDQLDLSVFASSYKLIALIDQDPASAKIRRRFEKRCRESGIPVHRLTLYSIENYFTVAAVRAVFGTQVPASLTEFDADTPVEKQLGFSVKKRNRAIVKNMTLSDIDTTDLAKFFGKVRKLLGD